MQQPSTMEAFTGITATDILRERSEAREAGRLAHTANTRGDFTCWVNCSCYTCRDYFDPTGEEDARRRNTPLPPPPPPSPPVLRRQNALCIECGIGHTCSEPCYGLPFSALARSPAGELSFSLPPPPPAVRMPRLASSISSVISPIAGVLTPRSLSEPLSIEEEVMKAEASLVRRLNHLIEMYNRLETHLNHQEQNSGSHDEMMMYQMGWDEMDKKRSAAEDLLNAIKH